MAKSFKTAAAFKTSLDARMRTRATERGVPLQTLQLKAADTDLGDFLTFRIGEPKGEFTNAPNGGGRFPCEAVLLGKTYAKFHLDVGIGDAVVGEPERLTGDDLLEFAGIDPAVALAIPKAQQFAEKIHAYTFPWSGRLNTRTKDLVDLVLLIEREPPYHAHIRSALSGDIFHARNTPSPPNPVRTPRALEDRLPGDGGRGRALNFRLPRSI